MATMALEISNSNRSNSVQGFIPFAESLEFNDPFLSLNTGSPLIRVCSIAHHCDIPVLSLDGPIVTVNVTSALRDGRVQQTFYAHENYVCMYSKAFQAAFSSPFAEGVTKEMSIEGTSATTFKSFLTWAYHKILPGEQETVDVKPWFQHHALLWIFADRYIIPALQNHIMYRMFGVFKHLENQTAGFDKTFASVDLLHIIYKLTLDNSPLRRIIVEYCTGIYQKLGDPSKLPVEMVIELFRNMQLRKDSPKFLTTTGKFVDYVVDEFIG